MKYLIVAIISLFPIISIADSCLSEKTVELDKNNGPLKNFKTNDQDGMGTCYANTASAMLTAAIKNNPDVSFLQLALLDKTSSNEFTDENLDIGIPCQTIYAAAQYGSICKKRHFTLETLFNQNNPDSLEKQKNIIDQLHNFYNMFDKKLEQSSKGNRDEFNAIKAFHYLGELIEDTNNSCQNLKYSGIQQVLLLEGQKLNDLVSQKEAIVRLSDSKLKVLSTDLDQEKLSLQALEDKYNKKLLEAEQRKQEIITENKKLSEEIEQKLLETPLLRRKKQAKLKYIEHRNSKISQNNAEKSQIDQSLKSLDSEIALAKKKLDSLNSDFKIAKADHNEKKSDHTNTLKEFQKAFELDKNNEISINEKMMKYLQNEYSNSISELSKNRYHLSSKKKYGKVYDKLLKDFDLNLIELSSHHQNGLMDIDQNLKNFDDCHYDKIISQLYRDDNQCYHEAQDFKELGSLPGQVASILEAYLDNNTFKSQGDTEKIIHAIRSQIYKTNKKYDPNWQIDFYKNMLGATCNKYNSIKFTNKFKKAEYEQLCEYDYFGYKESKEIKRKKIRHFAKKSLLTDQQPISLGVCSSLFYSTSHNPQEQECSTDAFGNHWITIIGQKCIKGKQYYKIMNSWGSECSETSPHLENCKNGRSWISEDNLMPQMYGLGSLNSEYIEELN